MCYLITGITLLVFAGQVEKNAFVAVLIGLGCLAYGAYIALTRGSYWVTSLTYAVPVLAIILLFSK